MSAPRLPALDTPVLFLVFNRPETTRSVFDSIRSARPSALFVAGDGPRTGVENDLQRCAEARHIATAVDWHCELQTRFPDRNLGPGPGVSSAITWFFDQVEGGIVLEDDCVPHPSFFRFCAELLDYYRDAKRVMHVTGHNYQYGRRRGPASYYFSTYTHVGGWATWARAWNHYDITQVPAERRDEIWDAAWMLSVRKSGGVAVIPNTNLVANIGFGQDATHTKTPGRYSFLQAHEIEFPLMHPPSIRIEHAADRLTYYANFRNVRFLSLVWLYATFDFVRLIPERASKFVALLRRWRQRGGIRS